ncbi:hypothetical protein M6B38_338010 [Iris pallida]|uniref:Uncharacterized protein n=1 Tax=Iris pallida TaxID=29817 RepID=A0AAX6GYF9_IRIPA|nr:hypothetical protein M6B38_130200 [Iris pallida]KAJ6833563.1 hypothetical protein M6B38_338010 [Iris pallida]
MKKKKKETEKMKITREAHLGSVLWLGQAEAVDLGSIWPHKFGDRLLGSAPVDPRVRRAERLRSRQSGVLLAGTWSVV